MYPLQGSLFDSCFFSNPSSQNNLKRKRKNTLKTLNRFQKQSLGEKDVFLKVISLLGIETHTSMDLEK